jgi:hypothetical protein
MHRGFPLMPVITKLIQAIKLYRAARCFIERMRNQEVGIELWFSAMDGGRSFNQGDPMENLIEALRDGGSW